MKRRYDYFLEDFRETLTAQKPNQLPEGLKLLSELKNQSTLNVTPIASLANSVPKILPNMPLPRMAWHVRPIQAKTG
jgi:hypothetical protein